MFKNWELIRRGDRTNACQRKQYSTSVVVYRAFLGRNIPGNKGEQRRMVSLSWTTLFELKGCFLNTPFIGQSNYGLVGGHVNRGSQ